MEALPGTFLRDRMCESLMPSILLPEHRCFHLGHGQGDEVDLNRKGDPLSCGRKSGIVHG